MALDGLGDSDHGRRLLAKAGLLAAMGGVTLMRLLRRGRRPRVRAAGDGVLLLTALAAVWLGASLVP
jgi:hypothetical protein